LRIIEEGCLAERDKAPVLFWQQLSTSIA
jgi:hypothetical protein